MKIHTAKRHANRNVEHQRNNEKTNKAVKFGTKNEMRNCSSILTRPQNSILDEPTIGLDSTSKIAVREFIKR